MEKCSKRILRQSPIFLITNLKHLLVIYLQISTVKQVYFHYQEGSLVDHQAYKLYTLVGPPALRLLQDPLAVIFLDNCLYMNVNTK